MVPSASNARLWANRFSLISAMPSWGQESINSGERFRSDEQVYVVVRSWLNHAVEFFSPASCQPDVEAVRSEVVGD